MQETWVPSLVWENPLEEEMAIHSSILAWEISWTEEPGGLAYLETKTTSQTTEMQVYMLPAHLQVESIDRWVMLLY